MASPRQPDPEREHALGEAFQHGQSAVSRERLNLSELARLLLLAMSRNASDRSSVRLSRNARGDTQIEVVVGAGEEGLDSVGAVAERVCEVYDQLRELYPLGEAAGGGGEAS